MPTSLTDSQADVVRQLLLDRGHGSDPEDEPEEDWPVFGKNSADGEFVPDDSMTVFNSAGVSAGRSQPTGELIGHLGFTVRFVAVDWRTGWAKANAVRADFATGGDGGVRNATVVIENGVLPARTYAVASVSRLSEVVDNGKEPTSKRNVFTLTGLLAVRQVS